MTGTLPQPLRSDARDNRDRILAVAREAFAADGLDVPMREIARRAEVGPATLYRRFPTKEALVAEAFAERMVACSSMVANGLADPDPWHGFARVIREVCELHALDRGFTVAFMTSFPRAADFGAERERGLLGMTELIRRAKAAGRLHADFTLDDIYLILMANNGIRTPSPAATVAASRRFAALMLRSFEARPADVPLPPAVRLALTPAALGQTSS